MSLVVTEDRGAVRHVVLNRPEKRNAMNQALLVELGDALRAAANDASVHCVVLRGEGAVFSAGVDLGELMSFAGDPGVLRPFRNVFLDCANLCEAMPKPVVCQIHRACFGGALEVALGCDLRIASDDAQLGLPEVKFGIIPDVGGSSRLPAVVGLGRAKELIMTAATIDAAEAHRIGLLNRVVARRRARGGHAGSGRRAARELPRRGRPRQARDRRLRAPGARETLEMEVAVQEYCVAAMREAAQAGAEDAGERGRDRSRRGSDCGSASVASPPGRPRACGCPAGGRGSPARARAQASSAGRSMPGLDPHLLEHRDEVLAGDVPGRARRHRAAAELAEARLEAVDPGPQRREHVREPLPARVVEVRGQLRLLAELVAPQREELAAPGAGWPSPSCRRSRSPARRPSCRRAAISSTRSGETWPS